MLLDLDFDNMSDDELDAIGYKKIGVGLYQKVNSNINDPTVEGGQKCASCGNQAIPKSILEKIAILGKKGMHIIESTISEKIDEVELEKRKSICELCVEVDSKGDKLYRDGPLSTKTCGEILYNKIDRNDQKDGCGCVLDLKWRIKDEKCPLNKW